MNAVISIDAASACRQGEVSPRVARQTSALQAPKAEWNILLAGSDPMMHARICPRLHAFGMNVHSAYTAREMWSKSRQSVFDLIILDFTLPDADGLDLCRRIRRASDIPIILVANPDEEAERVLGLELGADDWLVKPLDLRELAARIRTILRRAHGTAGGERPRSVVKFGNHLLKLSTRELVTNDGVPVQLANSIYRLLNAFLTSPGRVLSRDDLMYATHDRPSSGFDRTIDNHVVKLRQLLGDNRAKPELVRTVRGVGYLFSAEVVWV